jgi:hypothetical protein
VPYTGVLSNPPPDHKAERGADALVTDETQE